MKYQLSGLFCIACALSACGGGDTKPNNTFSSSSMAISSQLATSSTMSSISISSASMSSTVMSSAGMSSNSSTAVTSSTMASSSAAMMTALRYSVNVTNLTAGQPFSPLVYSLHFAPFAAFTIGMPASVGLEKIAESGASEDYIAEAAANAAVLMVENAMGLTLPGESKQLSLNAQVEADKVSQIQFSLVNMLGNTNDAFVGVNHLDIGKLEIGESITVHALSYDAGTELNSETQASIPGPAGGGEGFNSARDDTANQVTLHPGAVTYDDGKMDSTLTQVHRWDNPTARITVTRLAP